MVELLSATGDVTIELEVEDFTPLMAAVYQGRLSSILTFLRNGHDPLQVNDKGVSALMLAEARQDDYIIELLTNSISYS